MTMRPGGLAAIIVIYLGVSLAWGHAGHQLPFRRQPVHLNDHRRHPN